MAENVVVDPGSGGATIAADEIDGVHYPRSKIIVGANGVNDGDVSSANPLPVTAATLPLPSGAATSASQTTGNSSLSSIDGKITAVNTGAVVVASSALPSGASTAAKQPALGTAGTPSSDVITVQGHSSMTAIKTDASATTQPVSGTVTANLGTLNGAATSAKQDTIIGHVDGIETVLGTIDTDTGNVATSAASIDTKTPALGQALAAASVPVVLTAAQIATLTPPAAIAGFSTAANQATIIGHVDGLEGLLSTIDADTGNISTKIDTLAGAVAGLEMQVDLVGALPAGNNNIGDVDVASLPALATGTNTIGSVKLTDGTLTASVRDTGASDSLNVAIVDASGNHIVSFGGGTQYTEGDTDASVTGTAVMWEDGSDTLRVASAAKPLPVAIISGAGSGGTAAADDADFTAGTTAGTPAMGVYESTPTSVTDGDLGTVGITQTRALRTAVEGSVAVTNAGLTELAAAINGSSQVDVNIAASTTLTVAAHAVTNAGTFAVQAAQSGTWNITNISGTISLPTGAATLSEQQAQTTHLAAIAGDTTDIEAGIELLDDTVATLGTTTYTEATTKGLIIGAVRRDADTTLVDTTNEVGPLQMNAAGQVKVEVFSGETLPVSLTSTAVTGTVAVTQSGTWDEVGINDSGNSITVDAPVGTPVFVRLSDGASAIATLPVSLASVPSHAVTNAGTFAVQVDNTVTVASHAVTNAGTFAVQAAQSGTWTVGLSAGTNTNEVVGDAAHDAAAAGNPVLVGFEAKDFDGSALPSAVSDEGDVVRAAASLSGVQYVMVVNENGSDLGTVKTTGLLAHDAALAIVIPPTLGGGYAKASAPSDVSADGDAVLAWFLRNGAQCVNVTAAGALIPGDATNGLDVDVTRLPKSGTATVTSVADTASSTQLLASTAGRLGATFYNDSTVVAYLKLGTTASTTDFTVKIQPGGYYELPGPHIYTGRIDCIWASDASGSMRITELS